MRSQLRLGRVAGIPVGADWSLVVIFGLLAYVLATSVLPATVDASRVPTATPEESVRDVHQQLAQAPAVLVFDGADLVGTVTADVS